MPARSGRRFRLVLALACSPGLTVAAAHGRPLANGPELQVNAYTESQQGAPAVARLAGGDFVIAWSSLGSAGTDQSGSSVQARRLAAGGGLAGGELQVNAYTTADQSEPDVAGLPGGGFVVAWSIVSNAILDSIRAHRFGAGGGPVGGEIVVDSLSPGNQSTPAIGADAAGGFVVVWQSEVSDGDDHDAWSIQARRFAAAGTPLGAQFQVNQYTTGYQVDPAVAVRPDGGFVVAWQSDGSSDDDSSGTSVQLRLFDANGDAETDEIQANTFTTGGQGHPALDLGPEDEFVVAWTSYGSGGGDSDLSSIQTRRFGADGAALGEQAQVNEFTTSSQNEPAVQVAPGGEFVVAWTSYGSGGSDQSRKSLQARAFDREGAPDGGQFQVNAYTTEHQLRSTLAHDAAGNFVVAWMSFGSYGTDTSGLSVQTRRFDALFRDGFESGGTGRWSTSAS